MRLTDHSWVFQSTVAALSGVSSVKCLAHGRRTAVPRVWFLYGSFSTRCSLEKQGDSTIDSLLKKIVFNNEEWFPSRIEQESQAKPVFWLFDEGPMPYCTGFCTGCVDCQGRKLD